MLLLVWVWVPCHPLHHPSRTDGASGSLFKFKFQIKKMFIATSTLITHKIQSHIFATMKDDEAELIGSSMGSKQIHKLR